MDDLDRQLIGLLRGNARLPVATLAKRLRVARGTVQNRLSRLERDGVIGLPEHRRSIILRNKSALRRLTA